MAALLTGPPRQNTSFKHWVVTLNFNLANCSTCGVRVIAPVMHAAGPGSTLACSTRNKKLMAGCCAASSLGSLLAPAHSAVSNNTEDWMQLPQLQEALHMMLQEILAYRATSPCLARWSCRFVWRNKKTPKKPTPDRQFNMYCKSPEWKHLVKSQKCRNTGKTCVKCSSWTRQQKQNKQPTPQPMLFMCGYWTHTPMLLYNRKNVHIFPAHNATETALKMTRTNTILRPITPL